MYSSLCNHYFADAGLSLRMLIRPHPEERDSWQSQQRNPPRWVKVQSQAGNLASKCYRKQTNIQSKSGRLDAAEKRARYR